MSVLVLLSYFWLLLAWPQPRETLVDARRYKARLFLIGLIRRQAVWFCKFRICIVILVREFTICRSNERRLRIPKRKEISIFRNFGIEAYYVSQKDIDVPVSLKNIFGYAAIFLEIILSFAPQKSPISHRFPSPRRQRDMGVIRRVWKGVTHSYSEDDQSTEHLKLKAKT